MTKALIVVDVQNDFCEGGALAVEGGNKAAHDIAGYLEQHGDEYQLVIATRDWHDPHNDNGGHFADNPDFIDSWPPHCVADTHGAEFHPALWPVGHPYPHDEVRKGQGIPAYSGFEGINSQGQTLHDILQRAAVTEVDIVGIAFDYCVKATALDAAEAGFDVRVLTDLTAAIHSDGDADRILIDANIALGESKKR